MTHTLPEHADADGIAGAPVWFTSLAFAPWNSATAHDCEGVEVTNIDLSGARLRNVDLTGARVMEANLVNARFSGLIIGLVVNDIEVAPLITAEMDRRYPERRAAPTRRRRRRTCQPGR